MRGSVLIVVSSGERRIVSQAEGGVNRVGGDSVRRGSQNAPTRPVYVSRSPRNVNKILVRAQNGGRRLLVFRIRRLLALDREPQNPVEGFLVRLVALVEVQ